MSISRLVALILVCVGLLGGEGVRAETGVTDAAIRIGMSAPFNGASGAIGLEMLDSIRNYFDQVNAKDGVYGRKLELTNFDDGGVPTRAVENTKNLVENYKAFALIGYYGDASTTAALEVANSAKTPIIGTTAGAGSLRQPVNRYLFHVRASDNDEITDMVKQLATLGLTRIGVFYENDKFGKAKLEKFIAALKKFKLVPAVVGSIEPPKGFAGAIDVSAAMDSFSKSQPQALMMMASYKASAELVRNIKKIGWYPQLLALSTVGTDELNQLLGNDTRGIGISQVMPYPWDKSIPVVKEYQALRIQHEPNPIFTYAGLEGHIIAKILVEGLKKAGKGLTRDKLVNALETMNIDVGGYKVNYSATNHDGSNFVELTVIGLGGRVLK